MANEFEIDPEADESPDEALEWLMRTIKTKGIRTAYRAAEEVAGNSKAPPASRATASMILFRVAGLFSSKSDDAEEIEPHAMSGKQLEREIARLKRRQRSIAAASGDDSSDTGVFA